MPYVTTPAMLHPSKLQPNHPDLEVEPGLVQYKYKTNGNVNVQIANVSTRTIVIPPHAVLCELQPVTIQQQDAQSTPSSTSVLDLIEITRSDLTKDDLQTGKELMESSDNIFAKNDTDIGNTEVKHRIDLLDERPFKQRYRLIPPAMYEEVKAILQQLLSNGTIRPSKSLDVQCSLSTQEEWEVKDVHRLQRT